MIPLLHRLPPPAAALRLLPLAALIAVAGCAPPSAPLYHDYARPDVSPDGLAERIGTALVETGWELAAPRVPGAVATAPRTVRDYGLWRIRVSVEAVPVGERHVRVFAHPVREWAFGGRSKLSALDAGLRRALWAPLDDALRQEGLEPLPPLRQREAEAVRPAR